MKRLFWLIVLLIFERLSSSNLTGVSSYFTSLPWYLLHYNFCIRIIQVSLLKLCRFYASIFTKLFLTFIFIVTNRHAQKVLYIGSNTHKHSRSLLVSPQESIFMVLIEYWSQPPLIMVIQVIIMNPCSSLCLLVVRLTIHRILLVLLTYMELHVPKDPICPIVLHLFPLLRILRIFLIIHHHIIWV